MFVFASILEHADPKQQLKGWGLDLRFKCTHSQRAANRQSGTDNNNDDANNDYTAR